VFGLLRADSVSAPDGCSKRPPEGFFHGNWGLVLGPHVVREQGRDPRGWSCIRHPGPKGMYPIHVRLLSAATLLALSGQAVQSDSWEPGVASTNQYPGGFAPTDYLYGFGQQGDRPWVSGMREAQTYGNGVGYDSVGVYDGTSEFFATGSFPRPVPSAAQQYGGSGAIGVPNPAWYRGGSGQQSAPYAPQYRFRSDPQIEKHGEPSLLKFRPTPGQQTDVYSPATRGRFWDATGMVPAPVFRPLDDHEREQRQRSGGSEAERPPGPTGPSFTGPGYPFAPGIGWGYPGVAPPAWRWNLADH